MLRRETEMHEGAELRQMVGCLKLVDDAPEFVGKPLRSIVQPLLKFRAFLFKVCQDRLCSGEHQRMSHKSSCEESDADFGE